MSQLQLMNHTLKDADWPTPLRVEDPAVPVRRLPNVEEFIFWQGSHEEKKCDK